VARADASVTDCEGVPVYLSAVPSLQSSLDRALQPSIGHSDGPLALTRSFSSNLEVWILVSVSSAMTSDCLPRPSSMINLQ
jgi:hypothetical protein